MSLSSEEILTIPNGVPEVAGDPRGPRREFGLGPGHVVLLAAGNLRKRKGHMVLLEALHALRQAGCTVPWRLIVAGEGEERPRLEAFLAHTGMGSLVHLPGHRSDMADLLAAASVLVMPSLWEGLPLTVLEAMHAGKAIVASQTSGIPEAVRDGVDGLLVPPGDPDSLSDALRRILESPGERAAMGASALERARERFSIRRMVDDYERLYWDRE